MSPVTSLVPIHYQFLLLYNLLLAVWHSVHPNMPPEFTSAFSSVQASSLGVLELSTLLIQDSGLLGLSLHVLIADSAFHVLLSETDTSYLQLPTVCFFHWAYLLEIVFVKASSDEPFQTVFFIHLAMISLSVYTVMCSTLCNIVRFIMFVCC